MIYMKLFVDKDWITASAGMTDFYEFVNINEIYLTVNI